MRHVATAAVVFLFINALLLTAGAGWLAMSGRLSTERVRALVAIFADPVSAEEQAERQAAADARTAAEVARYTQLPGEPPIDSPGELERQADVIEQERIRLQRREREATDIMRQAQEKQGVLEQQKAAFGKERADFLSQRERIREIEGSEQFQKSLAALRTMDPEQSANLLKQGWERGDRDETIAYFDAMAERQRGAILSSLIDSGDDELAADLLEGLRTFGIASTPQGTADDPPN